MTSVLLQKSHFSTKSLQKNSRSVSLFTMKSKSSHQDLQQGQPTEHEQGDDFKRWNEGRTLRVCLLCFLVMLLMNRDMTSLDVTFSDVFTDSLDVLKLGGLEEPQSLPADSGSITKLELGLSDSPLEVFWEHPMGSRSELTCENPEQLEKSWEKSPRIRYLTRWLDFS